MKTKIILFFISIIGTGSLFSQEELQHYQFSDSKGNIFYIKSEEEINITKDSIVYLMGGDIIISGSDNNEKFYYDSLLDNYKLQIEKDKLNIIEVYELCFGNNFKCKETEIIKDSYYFKDGKLKLKQYALIPTKNKISKKTIKKIHKTIDNLDLLYTDDVHENLRMIDVLIQKLTILAIYGDLKSFLKLVEFNKLNNPEISYDSKKATRIVLNLNYINTKTDAIQNKLMRYLIND